MSFDLKEALPNEIYIRLVKSRIDRPELPQFSAERRQKKPKMVRGGRLNIVAADHPARGVISVGEDAAKMGYRREYLARVVRALSAPSVDGVMATMDILEELLILDQLYFEASRPSFLSNKVLIASLNRGGIQGAAWELNDPVTGTSPEMCSRYKFDGAKLLMRVNWEEPDSLTTISSCVEAINACNHHNLNIFLEPLPVRRSESGAWVLDSSAEAISRLVGVASALGDSSVRMWLKLPYCEDFSVVARATTLPIVLLGGAADGDPMNLLNNVSAALSTASNVRGALVGRNVLYPGDEDPLAMAQAIGTTRIVILDIDRRLRRIDPELPVGAAFYCTVPELMAAVGRTGADLGALVRGKLEPRELGNLFDTFSSRHGRECTRTLRRAPDSSWRSLVTRRLAPSGPTVPAVYRLESV